VNQEHLLESQTKTVAWLGAHGAGGEALPGRVGRIPEVDLGSFQLVDPVISFAQVEGGPLASKETQGTMGAEILRRFRLIVDYGHERLILEPATDLSQPFEYDMSGLHLMESDHAGFRVDEISEHSAAADAGIRAGDIVVAIDGKPAKDYTLTEVKEMFRQEKQYAVTVERGKERVDVQLKLRRLI
jgi:membrane-associated protease RseP (regulator of RpoE activity)